MTTFEEMHENLKMRVGKLSDEQLKREILEQMFIFYYEENANRRVRLMREIENNEEIKNMKMFIRDAGCFSRKW